ncbi:MAG: HAD family hydrolase [Breznakibacter sp.]
MTTGIKNILFDLGGVLVDLNKQACVDAFKAIGYPQAESMLSNYVQSGIFLELEEGHITPEAFYKAIMAEAPVTREQIDEAFFKFLEGIPQYKMEMLLELKKKYKILMLSNTNHIMFTWLREAYFGVDGHTIGDYFDELFLSYEMGVAKPNPEIFKILIEKHGIVPSETLFLDDGIKNIEAAAELGFKTYFVEPHEDFRHIFGLEPACCQAT